MDLYVLRLPKLIAERRSSAIFGVLIIAMLWAGVVLKYSEDVQGDRREAERSNQNFAMVFEENVLRSIGEIDKALLYLRRSIETRKASTDFNTIANTTDVLSEIIVQVAIIDAAGIMRASNVGPQPAARALPGACEQQGGSAIHQQASDRARQRTLVGAGLTAIQQPRQDFCRRGGRLARPRASNEILQ
jgi:hypothetical protein